MANLKNKKILMFVDHIYEDLELWYPKIRLIEEGANVIVAGPEAGIVYEGKHGYPCESDISINDIKPEEYDGLVIPGGFAPDKLRRLDKVLETVRYFHEKNLLIAHICHAGWITISAGIMKGYRCTSTPGIKDDITNSGAVWVDEPVVVDRNMISSRRPDDLPDYCKAIISYFEN